MIISFTMKYTIDNVARAVAAKTLYDERIVKEVAMYMFKKALEKNNEFGVTSVIVGHFGYFTQNLAELKKFYKRNEKNIAFTKKYVTDDYDRRMTRLLRRREDLKIRIYPALRNRVSYFKKLGVNDITEEDIFSYFFNSWKNKKCWIDISG